jgi:hypothetical protein
MRTLIVAGTAGLLLLTACTGDDPTVDPSPTETTDPTDLPSPRSETTFPTALPSTPDATEPQGEEGMDDHNLVAVLSGAHAVPGPGDPAGSGEFRGRITPQENSVELCYELTVSDLASGVTAAHIHAGAPGEAGEVLIPLLAPVSGRAEDCVVLNATEALGLLDDAEGHYVNVHTQGHPDSAIRGQLESV